MLKMFEKQKKSNYYNSFSNIRGHLRLGLDYFGFFIPIHTSSFIWPFIAGDNGSIYNPRL